MSAAPKNQRSQQRFDAAGRRAGAFYYDDQRFWYAAGAGTAPNRRGLAEFPGAAKTEAGTGRSNDAIPPGGSSSGGRSTLAPRAFKSLLALRN
jgi:hypothetical protein